MIKRSFIGLSKPRLEYQLFDVSVPEPLKISPPKNIILLIGGKNGSAGTVMIKEGESVKTGQTIARLENPGALITSTVTGTVSSIAPYTGDFGQSYAAISIDVASKDELDEQFKTSSTDVSLETVKQFLSFIPGKPSFDAFSDPEKPIDTIVVCGADKDLLMCTNQYIVRSKVAAIKKGVQILKDITGVSNVIMVVPQNLMQEAAVTGAEARGIDCEYPSALPHSIMKDVLGKVIPAGQRSEDLGVCFFNAEAVASIGTAFETGTIPVKKTLTFIDKSGSIRMITATIGTPVGKIIRSANISLQDKDRIIIGGPMTGSSVYSEDYPIQPDTDGIIVQDKESIPRVSDYPCINCGQCVRICPALMPVSMLVRYLEAGRYEDAADSNDLYSCIECGLCSYVCVSRIPIFQYIRLAKYELDRVRILEAENA